MNDVSRLVLDANIMASALLGRSFGLFVEFVEQGVELFTTEPQLIETRRTLATRPQADDEWVDGQIERLLTAVVVLPGSIYAAAEERARLRLHERGQPDWSVLAASIEGDVAIWSHDKDLFGSGGSVWSTTMLYRQFSLVA